VREDERVAKALAEAGFATARAARAARLSASQQAALSKAVDDWRRQRHAAAERASVLEAALGKKARDAKALTTIEGQLEQAERELAECRQKRDDGLQQESRLDQQRRDLERRLAEADSKRKELETARAQLGPLRQLSLDLRSNQFQAYLLDETFRELVAGASQQLLALSGRYEFEYEKDAFFVLDHDNASERRRVETLSGGETFLASLALALELSQQVQRAAGAVDIGSLFIDEGFGTLDAESLRIVADAVENLPTAGRMVGIITHLPELTALLPVCIQIEKGPDGSRLAVRAA
jgi:exonuclease SbcC